MGLGLLCRGPFLDQEQRLAKFSLVVVTFLAAFRASESKDAENIPFFPRKTSGAAGGGFYWLLKRHLSVPGVSGSRTSIIQEVLPALSL